MASESRQVSLGDVSDLLVGYPFKSALYSDNASSPLLLRGDNVGQGTLRWDNAKRWDLTNGDSTVLQRYYLSEGDVVLAMDRPWIEAGLKYARVTASDRPCLLVQRVARLRGTPACDSRYLMFVVGSAAFSTFVQQVQTGTAVPHISASQIQSFRFLLPPLAEQRAIAHILGTLDDKIELNRQMSATLEAMARALFESWFVRFDPVRAKAEGRDTGLPADIAALFPDSFEQSEIGDVPKGWRVASLGALVDVARGLSYKGDGLSASGLPMFNLNSVLEGGGYKQAGLKHYAGAYKEQHLISAGDVIVANTEQGHERRLIGFAALVPARIPQPALFSHHLYRVRARDAAECSNDFIYRWLNTLLAHDVVSGYANGTTVNMLPTDGLQTPQLCVPPPQLCSRFTSMNSLSQARQEELQEQTTLLTDLRDTLLPKLISGDLRVPDAERFLADAGVS